MEKNHANDQGFMTIVERIIRKVSRMTMLTVHGLLSTTRQPLSRELLTEIATYRNQIKIYDAFIFYNELELLEIRLNILDPYVDYFVIVECSQTFSGKPKPLYFSDNKDRFAKFAHKIIHCVIDDSLKTRADFEERFGLETDETEREIIRESLTNSNVPKGQDRWLREFYQRESIKKALVGARDSDFCFVSDVDEIWNPELIIDYRNNSIYKFRQLVYSYYFNNRSSEPWAGTFATQYKNIRLRCLGNMRDAAKTTYTYVDNGGWHFTNQGGADRIKQKIESYSHQEFNTATVKESLEKNISENRDFVGRNFTFWIDESELPSYLLEQKECYKENFKKV